MVVIMQKVDERFLVDGDLTSYCITDMSTYIPTFNASSILDAIDEASMNNMQYDYNENGEPVGVDADVRLASENLDVTEMQTLENILKNKSDNMNEDLRREIDMLEESQKDGSTENVENSTENKTE